jgi:hypothetical protein
VWVLLRTLIPTSRAAFLISVFLYCDREASIMRKPCPTRGCCTVGKENIYICAYLYGKFTVFHVRALYDTKTLITNKCTKSFIINRNALLHVSTLLGHLQGEFFCYRCTKVALYSWVRMCCWLCTVAVNSLWSRPAGPARREYTPPNTPQYTASSTFSLNCKVQP